MGITLHRDKKLMVEEALKRVLILGKGHIASHCLVALMSLNEPDKPPSMKVSVAHRNDPRLIFNNPDAQRYAVGYEDEIKLHQVSDYDFLNRLVYGDGDTLFDTIINCDSIHDVRFCNNNPIETAMHNEVFITTLLEGLRKTHWEGRFIHLSSDKVYGPGQKLPITEETLPNPVGVRSGSRLAQEIKIASACKSGNLRYIILRLGNIFGEYTPMETCINSWIYAALMNEPIKLFGGDANKRNCRDFVSIYDISHLIKQLSSTMVDDRSIDNEIYNIGSCYKTETHLENITEGIKHVFRPIYEDISTENGPWRNKKEEEKLSLWLDCQKATDQLKWEQMKQFDSYSYKEVALHIATYELKWNDLKMYDLERALGIFDESRKMRVLKAKGLPTGLTEDVARNVGRLNKEVERATHEMLNKPKQEESSSDQKTDQ